MRKGFHHLAFAAALLAAGIIDAAAQSYPSKPINLLVPAAAGGPTDTVARLIAESMTKTLGQTVVVENMGGAGGTLHAQCFPSRDFVLGRVGPGGSFSYLSDGRAASDGSIDVGPVNETDLPVGTKVQLLCDNAHGFTQSMVTTVS